MEREGERQRERERERERERCSDLKESARKARVKNRFIGRMDEHRIGFVAEGRK